ncbi:carbohydrate ABC transporter permease [Ethanoligenens harbinense]|uniref:Binding-protein-dependent transport systems inner membrane component n=1 Tax=Ethanoligenens harbinense (strain DSM 18485 / JCM 12961 / CGMCC 1.5033 / YUAN-3) TaxID=663278 RepID=E6U585_ETHHY|nr:ABC transporter permease subunit [Ethanoligenens harbinense]ADU27898.1 binding-protein-dependent transport systems inner membrane component [Ethanoligenens harbinense YUAN-3]AVQ96927.1 sugar ABC transporter permease [Ethanoligenens harbinense YUAN-3]AYF39588.1 sugar ABC transporter permease [Ethanoligenens harbinense]AYF42414.1 sugar ABC transporter permease [Ethanoligenens harbinense]QCN93167.1 sugar ABC transporter permease [Ethanoligenens harbinense]
MYESRMRTTARAALYLMPAMVILVVFKIYPIVRSFLMSFYTKYNYFTDVVSRYGLDNYAYIFRDPEFWRSMGNTFLFVVGVVPISIVLSLLIACLLNQKIRFRALFRTVFFLPFVTSVVAISIVWRWIFHSQYGLLNYFLELVGIPAVKWLTDPNFAMPALVILAIWKGLGYNIVIFLAGLQNIDERYYLAARIDGAFGWQRFKRLTVPLLSGTTLFVSIIAIISSFKVFDEVYALFGGQMGPAGSAETMVYYIYSKFYGSWNFGVASAAAYVLFLVIFVFTLIQLKFGSGGFPWKTKKYAVAEEGNGHG